MWRFLFRWSMDLDDSEIGCDPAPWDDREFNTRTYSTAESGTVVLAALRESLRSEMIAINFFHDQEDNILRIVGYFSKTSDEP